MNWVDLVILALLLFFTLEGIGRGFVSELLDLLAFLVAFIFSLRFYNLVASFYSSNFQMPHSLSNVLGFITLWFLIETVLFSLIKIFFLNIPGFIQLNKHLKNFSFFPAFFRGLIFISIILVMVGTFPIQPKVKQAVNHSRIGPLLIEKTLSLEAPLKNVFGGITQDTLTFLTIKPKSDESINLGFKTGEFLPNQELEEQMIVLVNAERVKQGLKPLKFSQALRDVARVHSSDMFKRGYFSHYSPEGENVADRANKVKYDYLIIGENLAYAPNLNLAHTGLMNSPGHRANILSKEYSLVGIGAVESKIYGLMVTQVFSN